MGTLLSICGSYGMAGAALLATKAALRMGIGLHKLALSERIYPIVAQAIPESVYLPLSEPTAAHTERLLKEMQSADAVLIGCGLSLCDNTRTIVNSFIEKCKIPMVLDADALNVVAENPEILKNAAAPIIITPHPGEFARLTASTPQAVNADREQLAAAFAKQYGVVTVLKGKGTVIAAPDGTIRINPTGNSGMATGGSGDVLAGMIASLTAQGANLFDAAAAAVYLHGLAGDIAAERLGKISMLPSDLIDCIPAALKSCGAE